jgi:hypothetical protein
MLEFKLTGILTGVKSSEKAVYLTVKPDQQAEWCRRGDRQSSYNMQLAPSLEVTSLPPVGSHVELLGEGVRVYTDWTDPVSKREKEIENHRFMIITVKPLAKPKAAASAAH